MRTFFVYLFLEFKKSVKVLVKSAGSFLLMLCMVMAGAAAASYVFFGAQMFKVIDVGVAILEEETQTKAVVRFLSAMESVESICNFEYLTQDAAMEKLYDGEIQAVIVLPESLYDDMYTGQKGKISVYLPGEAPFQVQVFQELLSDGVSLLQTAEAGVLASRNMAEDGFSKMRPGKVAESISYTYIECALNREELFDKNVYSPLGQMDLYQYYFAAAVSVLLLMSGLNYSFLYQGQSRAVEQKLRVLGLGAVKLSVIKILVMANMSWILGTAAYLSGCLFSKWQKSYFIWFHKEILLWMIPVSIAAAVYFHIVFSAFGKGMQGAVFLLLANAMMILCAGVVIPSAYLPGAVRKIGAYLPLGILHQYCIEMFFGSISGGKLLLLAGWSLTGIGIGAIFSWHNTLYGTRYS